MRTGGIPKKIALFIKAPKPFATHNPWANGFKRAEVKELSVSPTMPTDADSQAQRATAEGWASEGRQLPFTVRETENAPFNIRIIGLEARGEGGRAWKVITEDGLLFDMREEVLLEASMTCGIAAGGVPNGEFIFAREGSQMKIIRVGSDIHGEFTAAETRRTSSSIKKGDLKPGAFYRTRGPACILYFGRVSKGGQHLSLKVLGHSVTREKPADILANVLATGYGNGSQFQTTGSLSVVEAIEELPLPADYAAQMRAAAKANVLKYLDKSRYHRPMSRAEMAQQARAFLPQMTLILNFDPDAESGAQSEEYKSVVAAIEAFEK